MDVQTRCKKLDLAEIRKDKVGKKEFNDYLPEYLSPEAIENRIREYVDERVSIIE